MCGVLPTNSPTTTWERYVNGGTLCFGQMIKNHVPSLADINIDYLNAKGLRPVMDPKGATVIIRSTGIILIRSPFPLSALHLRPNSLMSCLLNYVLLYHRHTWIK